MKAKRGELYKLDDKFDFGKYGPKSRNPLTIREAIDQDPTYVQWCIENVDGFFLEDADLELEEGLEAFYADQVDYLEPWDDWHPGHPSNYGDR